MTGTGPSVEALTETDLDAVETHLAANGLPTADVRSSDVSFIGAFAEDGLVAVGGLEVYDRAALIRSVAVDPEHRGAGFGSFIVSALEARARSDGASWAYLLTETAEGFFRRLGYHRCRRATVPEAVHRSAEFSDICPTSATCMRTRL